jgi:hypothetical protein
MDEWYQVASYENTSLTDENLLPWHNEMALQVDGQPPPGSSENLTKNRQNSAS